MRAKKLLAALSVLVTAASGAALAQQGGASGDTEVTGVVQTADTGSGKIVINGQAYIMSKGAGTAMMPSEGDQITLFYQDRGGEKVITRIGQKRQ